MLCGGAQETHLATCHNIVTPRKTEEFLKSPYFLDLNCSKIKIQHKMALGSQKFKVSPKMEQLFSFYFFGSGQFGQIGIIEQLESWRQVSECIQKI